jgi:glycosyltransferase involved in cell wall biosynthesis
VHIDVVVPTRDRPGLVAEAVNSVLAQTHEALRVVVVDDGSVTPLSLPTADPRVEVVHLRQPGGPQAAREVGLRRATGDFVATLDCDDLWVPTKLEKQLSSLLSATHGAVITWHEWRSDVNSAIRRPRGPSHPLMTNNMSSPLFTRQSLEVAGGFLPAGTPPLPTAEHIEFWIRYTEHSSVGVVPEVLTTCREHAKGRQSDKLGDLAAADALRYVLEEHQGHLARFPNDLASVLASTGVRYLDAGKIRVGLDFLRRALAVQEADNRRALLTRYLPFAARAAVRRAVRWT